MVVKTYYKKKIFPEMITLFTLGCDEVVYDLGWEYNIFMQPKCLELELLRYLLGLIIYSFILSV